MASPSWQSRLFVILRLLGAVALLGWAFYRLPVESATSWPSVAPGWLMGALGLSGLSVLGWAGRWWWFLRVYKLKARFLDVLRLTFYADFFNFYFLGPLGADGIRLLMLGRQFPQQRGALVGSLLLDHIGGLFGGALLYAMLAHSSGLPTSVLTAADSTLLLLGTLTFLGLGVIMEPALQRLLAKWPLLGWLTAKATPLYAGTFRHPWLFSGFAVSFLGTSCAYAAYWAAAHAVGAPLPLNAMLGLMPVVDGLASLPVTISGVGIRENLLVAWLSERMTANQALTTSLVGFAALGVWGVIGGLMLLAQRRTTPSE